MPEATTALPPRLAGFTAREPEMMRLLPCLAPVSDRAPQVSAPVVVVVGMGGIGKTAFAVEAAYRAIAEGHLPGGTLMVDLQGYGDAPVTADQAVLALLDALGARSDELPEKPIRRHEMYQRMLAARQEATLLILDNASDPAQYLRLLPTSPGATRHRALITSRDRPDSLALDVIGLDELSPAESATLVARALGDHRPAREPAALARLTSLCGHLPLALHIAAAMLRRRRPRGIASLVDDIAKSNDPTLVLDSGGRGTDEAGRPLVLRPVLAASCRRLTEDLTRLLRLLALAPGRDIGTPAVAALADLDIDRAYEQLEKLAAAHLVTAFPSGGDTDTEVRWRLHDLVRAYALGLTETNGRLVEEGEAARERVLDFYYQRTQAADDWLRRLPGTPPPDGFSGREAALAWLNEERTALIAAAQWVDRKRHASTALLLAERLGTYLAWRRYYDDWISVGNAAQEAAHRAKDPTAEAVTSNQLGLALREVSDTGRAIEEHTRARELYHAAGNLQGEAMACGNLGNAHRKAGRMTEAIRAQTQARDLFRAAGDPHGEAMAWGNLGLALQEARRFGQALMAHSQARLLFETVGDPRGESTAWNNIGVTLRKAHKADEAVAAHHEAVTILKELGEWYRSGQTYEHLAQAHESLGDPASAREARLCATDAYTRAGAPTDADRTRNRIDGHG